MYVIGSTQAVSVLHILGLLKTIITSLPSQVTISHLQIYIISNIFVLLCVILASVLNYLSLLAREVCL